MKKTVHSISPTTLSPTMTARLKQIMAGQSSLAVASTSLNHIPSSPWAAPPKKTAAVAPSPSPTPTNKWIIEIIKGFFNNIATLATKEYKRV